MKNGLALFVAVAMLLGAVKAKAQEVPKTTVPPADAISGPSRITVPPTILPDATVATPPMSMPGGAPATGPLPPSAAGDQSIPTTCPVGCISAPLHRHPLWSWLTYQPARRPWLDGHCVHKAPNIQPPLYDYFPCMGRTCDVPASPGYNPCVGPYPYRCPVCDGKTLRCGPNGCTPVY